MELGHKQNTGPFFGVRHIQALLLFFNKVVIFNIRTHVTVTVMAMTNATTSNTKSEQYNWSKKEKSYIFSSMFWGFLIAQIPIGYFIRRYRVKTSLLLVTLGSGVFNALVPICVSWGGWKLFCCLRFLQGLCQAGASPSCLQHLANWTPPAEKNRLNCIMVTGLEIGVGSAVFMSGYLSESSIGWPAAFYMSSLLCFIWCIFWLIFGANNVTESKFINKAEFTYIEQALKNSVDFHKVRVPVPLRAIFTSAPVWSLIIVRTAESWSYFIIQTELPSYMNGVFNMHIKDNALYSSLPYILGFLMTIVFMIIADFIRIKEILSLTASRKFFNSLSMWLPAAGMIWIGFLDVEHKFLAILITTISVSIASAVYFGSIGNCMDIAPNHAEMIAAISEFGTCISLIAGPLFAGAIVSNETSRAQWQIVFAAVAISYCIGDLTFLIFGTSQIQPWNAADFLIKKNDVTNLRRKSIKNNILEVNNGIGTVVQNSKIKQTHF